MDLQLEYGLVLLRRIEVEPRLESLRMVYYMLKMQIYQEGLLQKLES
jgi:hypothetical protein|nr:MAG TPA: hypothetical protein [Caudoviricetes sp.]